MSLQLENILNAMDGVALILDSHLRITHVGKRTGIVFLRKIQRTL